MRSLSSRAQGQRVDPTETRTHDPSREGEKGLNTDLVEMQSSNRTLAPQEEVKAQHNQRKSKSGKSSTQLAQEQNSTNPHKSSP
jgi:hypothetical protein